MSLALVCATTVAAADRSPPEIIATWSGGQVLRGDYDSWRNVEGLEDNPDAIREFIFVQSFAELARKRGAESDIRVKLGIEIARRRSLGKALQDRAVAAVKVTDEEIEALRLAHPEAFTQPRKLLLRTVYKKLGDDPVSISAVRAQMQAIHQKLLDGADFTEIARRESESQSRFKDGSIGFVDPDEMPTAIGEAVRGLISGAISKLVESGGAVMFFLCDKVKDAAKPTADEVRAKLRKNLTQIRKKEAEQLLGENLLESADIEINPESEGTVLRVGDYRLDAKSLVVLMKIKIPTSSPSDWDDGARRKLLRNWAIGWLEDRRASALGLDKSAPSAEILRWQPTQVLARDELVRRIDKTLEPPTAEAMRRHFTGNANRYREPERTRLSTIQFGMLSPKKGAEVARLLVARAELAEKQINSGDLSFADAARRYSTAPFAARGGDAGTLTRPQIGALGSVAKKAISELKLGEHTGLLRLRSGLWMFEVHAREPARKQTFTEASAAIKRELRDEQVKALEVRLREELWARSKININPVQPAKD